MLLSALLGSSCTLAKEGQVRDALDAPDHSRDVHGKLVNGLRPVTSMGTWFTRIRARAQRVWRPASRPTCVQVHLQMPERLPAGDDRALCVQSDPVRRERLS